MLFVISSLTQGGGGYLLSLSLAALYLSVLHSFHVTYCITILSMLTSIRIYFSVWCLYRGGLGMMLAFSVVLGGVMRGESALVDG